MLDIRKVITKSKDSVGADIGMSDFLQESFSGF